MKKHLLLIIAFLAFAWAGQAQTTDWYTSNPTATSFTIHTADELAGQVNAGNDFAGDTILLAGDIDLGAWLADAGTPSDYKDNGWLPIGKFDGTDIPFRGTFDGAGHTIKGLWINRGGMNNVGLIGLTGSPAVIRNLTVTIDTGTAAISKGVKGNDFVGGLVGNGWEATITDCAALPVSGTTGTMVTGNNRVGGLVGTIAFGSISNCYATGAVTGDIRVGGLVGGSQSPISNCYATGAVTGDYSGGLVGANDNSISNSYATGAMTGSNNGGLVGDNEFGSITASFFDNTVNNTLNVTGYGSGYITNSYGLPTADMKKKTSYTSWNFTTWALDSQLNNGYPILQSHYPTIDWYLNRTDGITDFTFTTAEELAGLALLVNAGHPFGNDTTFTLGGDIDLTDWLSPTGGGYDGGQGWTPIGK